MRAGLSTIQQTLTPEAASVLNQSIGEAGRRNHGQTTPLHVAATLLASPSGYLRQACIRSHPNSSHPLQCRALELCFTVALDRLPSSQSLSPSLEPPISNALMAALKRAQAHQRRGCPEQQQQPLLAVKVELEQLIISILDDPSVSRVMREASFSSPAVKATIEQSLNSSSSVTSTTPSISSCGLGFRPQSANRSLYMNPRLQQQQQQQHQPGTSDQAGGQRKEEVKKVVDILLRNKKRNPVLVGESEPELVVRELLQRIERKDVGESSLKNVHVISLEKEVGSDRSKIPMKLKELGELIDNRISSSSNEGGGVILNLGDLKWLVEQPAGFGGLSSGQVQQQIVSETGKVAVSEMGKLLARCGEGNGRLWLVGTATCETYLRCQVYHPSMENDWDLQAVPIAARAPLPGLFPRMGGSGILSSSVESLKPLKNFPSVTIPLARSLPVNIDPGRRTKCCPLCMQNYEQDLVKLKVKDSEKSSSEDKSEATRQALPQWLQIAKSDSVNNKLPDQLQTKDQETEWKQKAEELQRKWNDTCSRLHHNVTSQRASPNPFPMMNLYNPRLLGSEGLQPKLHLNRNLGGNLRLNQNTVLETPSVPVVTPPGSPVRTDLALACPKIPESTPEKTQTEQHVRDFIGCIPSEPEEKFSAKKDKLANILDPDSFKSLFKGLAEKVWWQNEAASEVAANVIQCRSGNSKRQGFGWKGDAWLLFAGPDRVGKKKMAITLSELVCRSGPVIIRLGSRNNDEEFDVNFRGKTTLDRIAEAVQRNPSSVVVLEDFDQADMLVRGSIKRAFDRGRLPDSHGREVSLKNVIFILTANGLPENPKDLVNRVPLREEELGKLSQKGWQLQLSVCGKTRKRGADWLHGSNRQAKSRTIAGSALSFDLNEAALVEDDRAEGSLNSSDLTVDQDHEHNLISNQPPMIAIPRELLNCVDEVIVFKPVDFGALQKKVANTISTEFLSTIGEQLTIEVDKEALEHIVGGIWFGRTELDEWAEKVLVPSFNRLKHTLPSKLTMEDNTIVKLVSVSDTEKRYNGDLLPSKITIITDEL
ncbi:Smax1-like [Thalictrum thalictroides]|uniref:Smax1-like n=1 Tax=Thalictrum thalictroides TaxID=46969 RepID=A0A7J6V9L1_THATH|nr:Smax1-like [Thalictrum thalictroides]